MLLYHFLRYFSSTRNRKRDSEIRKEMNATKENRKRSLMILVK